MNKIVSFCYIFIFCSSLIFIQASANHLPGNFLTVRHSGTGNNYTVKLVYYRDCQSLAAAQQASVIYHIIGSAGTSINLPLISSITIPLLSCTPVGFSTCVNGTGVEENIYEANVILTQPGKYRFYNEVCCRSATSTYNNSAPVYVEAILDIQLAPGNSLPDFIAPPQFYFCLNNPATYQSLATDNDGDSMVYSLSPALDNSMGTPVSIQYTFPYTYLNFIPSTTPITFNTLTCTATFTPSQFTAGVIVFKVEEYRNGISIGSIMRETNLIITNGTVGINKLTNNFLQIYPNPATNNIHFKYKITSWMISDMSGSVLKTGNKIMNDNEYYISINDLSSGIYLIHLFDGNNRLIKKFIKA